MGGPEIERLIALLARLPGLGPRSARRTALRLLQEKETRLLPLAQALTEAARAVRACTTCGNLDTADPCSICTDPHRDHGLVCVGGGGGATSGRWSAPMSIAAPTTCSAARSRRWPAPGRRTSTSPP